MDLNEAHEALQPLKEGPAEVIKRPSTTEEYLAWRTFANAFSDDSIPKDSADDE